MTVEIVSLTLSEYLSAVRQLSLRYQGDENAWFQLTADQITEEEDRDEFAFIRMALWDQLMHEEFYKTPPLRMERASTCDTVEPGNNFPGSPILGGQFWVHMPMPIRSLAY